MTHYLKPTLFMIIFCWLAFDNQAQNKFTLSGEISDSQTGETLLGATIRVKDATQGTVSNLYGFYSLTLPQGTYILVVSFTGYTPEEITLNLNQNIKRNFALQSATEILEEVVVTSEDPDENISNTDIGSVEINVEKIAQVPAIGEADLIRVLKLLPGVQSTSESSSGFSVRGGNPDQNLILLDEAIVYNPSHLLGFFSAFNNDAIKNVKLYKGHIPARYGGRLSSVLDVRMKEGNNQQLSFSGGLSLISARLAVESPIIKNKGSVMLTARRTYADLIAKMVTQSKQIQNSELYFYDINFKANYKIGTKDRLFISSYFGNDIFKLDGSIVGTNFKFKWGNNTITARWNHIFNPRLFLNTSFILSRYKYGIGAGDDDFSFSWDAILRDFSVKMDFDYFINEKNSISMGLNSTYHNIKPGEIIVDDASKPLNEYSLSGANSIEHSLYLGNTHQFSPSLTFEMGVRGTLFQNVGPSEEYIFDENYNKTETIHHAKGKIFNTYFRVDPRLSANYRISPSSSIKLSMSRNHQFLQLASNSMGGSLLDVWFPSSPNLKPQVMDQFSIGYFKNFVQNVFEASVEWYYRRGRNQIDFKDHAEILLNKELVRELRVGNTYSYGIEMYVKKMLGRLTGWVSLTLSRARRRVPTINNGNLYRSPYERPINFSVVANYHFSKNVMVSSNWVYYSGMPFTTPTGKFVFENEVVSTFTERNKDRMPSYHRLDVGVTVRNKKNDQRRFKGEWVISIYNVYGRKNANMIIFQDKANPANTQLYQKQAVQYTVFRWVPSVSYNFKF